MERTHVRGGAVVRVIERSTGTRIQVVVLGRGEVHEFHTWAGALRFVRQATRWPGLR